MEREQLNGLVTGAQNGDSEALNSLFNEFYNDVYYFALKTVKDENLACDITQESFVEIIGTIGNLQEPAAFVTWMKQITYHQCTRYFKKKKDVLVDEDEDGNTVFDCMQEERAEFIPDEALDQADFRKTIMDMLDTLSEEQRAATLLYYYDELSVKQIAEIQGVSEGTVKSRLNYARKSLKESVESYEKKTGIKLHSVGILPLMLWLFRGYFAQSVPAAAVQNVAVGISAATGAAVSATAGTTATASAATATAAGVTTSATTTAVGIKIAAGVVAASLTLGGGIAAIALNRKPPAVPTEPVIEEPVSDGIVDDLSLIFGNPDDESWNVTACFANSVYEEMSYVDSVDDLTAEQAARLLYGFLRMCDPTEEKFYEGFRTDIYHELCRRVYGKTFDLSELTGEYAYYEETRDAVIFNDKLAWNDALRGYSLQADTPEGLHYVNVFGAIGVWNGTDTIYPDSDFAVTVFTQLIDGQWRLHSIQPGGYYIPEEEVIEPEKPYRLFPEHADFYLRMSQELYSAHNMVSRCFFQMFPELPSFTSTAELSGDDAFRFLSDLWVGYVDETGRPDFNAIPLSKFNELSNLILNRTYTASDFSGKYAIYHPEGDFLEISGFSVEHEEKHLVSDGGYEPANVYEKYGTVFLTPSETKPEGQEGEDYLHDYEDIYLLPIYSGTVTVAQIDGTWKLVSYLKDR